MKIFRVGAHSLTGIPGMDRQAVMQWREEHPEESITEHPDYVHQYFLEIQRWERRLWIKSKLYHWFVFKVAPLSGWLAQHFPGDEDRVLLHGAPSPRWRDKISAWDVTMDLKCATLHSTYDKIAEIEVGKETYNLF